MEKWGIVIVVILLMGLTLNSVSAVSVSMNKVSSVTINNHQYDVYATGVISLGIKDTIEARTCSGDFTGELIDVNINGMNAIFSAKIGNYQGSGIELRANQFTILYIKNGYIYSITARNYNEALESYVENKGLLIIYTQSIFLGVSRTGAVNIRLICLKEVASNSNDNGGNNGSGSNGGGSGTNTNTNTNTQSNTADISELKKAWLQWLDELSPGYDKVFDQKTIIYSEPYILVYRTNEIYSQLKLSKAIYSELSKTSLDATVYIYTKMKTEYTPQRVDVILFGIVLPKKYYDCSCKTVQPYSVVYSSSTVSALNTLKVDVHIPYSDMVKLVEDRPDLKKSYNDYLQMFAIIKSAYLKANNEEKQAIVEFYKYLVNPSYYVLYTIKYPYMFIVIHTTINNQNVNIIVPVYIRSNTLYFWMTNS